MTDKLDDTGRGQPVEQWAAIGSSSCVDTEKRGRQGGTFVPMQWWRNRWRGCVFEPRSRFSPADLRQAARRHWQLCAALRCSVSKCTEERTGVVYAPQPSSSPVKNFAQDFFLHFLINEFLFLRFCRRSPAWVRLQPAAALLREDTALHRWDQCYLFNTMMRLPVPHIVSLSLLIIIYRFL